MEGRFNGGFFVLPVWEAYILEGLIFGILWYLIKRALTKIFQAEAPYCFINYLICERLHKLIRRLAISYVKGASFFNGGTQKMV